MPRAGGGSKATSSTAAGSGASPARSSRWRPAGSSGYQTRTAASGHFATRRRTKAAAAAYSDFTS